MVLAAIQAASMAFFCVLEVVRPRRAEGIVHHDTGINLLTGIGLAAVKWGLLGWLIEFIDSMTVGWVPIDRLPSVAQWLVAFLLLDFARWALHLAHHRVPVLWAFHRVHHSSERLNATSGLRMHVVDFVQLALVPGLLFGVVLDTGTSPAWLIPAVLAPGIVFDAFAHSNLALAAHRAGWRVWDAVLNNPHFHAWHHTDEGHLCDGNYGNTLTIWDTLFRTRISRPELPAGFGLDATDRLANDVVGLQMLRRR